MSAQLNPDILNISILSIPLNFPLQFLKDVQSRSTSFKCRPKVKLTLAKSVDFIVIRWAYIYCIFGGNGNTYVAVLTFVFNALDLGRCDEFVTIVDNNLDMFEFECNTCICLEIFDISRESLEDELLVPYISPTGSCPDISKTFKLVS
jgi:hypothetical protein